MGSNQGQSSTQDNVVKSPVYMPTPDNLAGNESGTSTTAGLGTSSGTQAAVVNPTNINIDASSENRSAKYKYPSISEDVPEAARNQYQ